MSEEKELINDGGQADVGAQGGCHPTHWPPPPPPPPWEIVCVDVKKVFDSCSNVDCEEFCVQFYPTVAGVTITPAPPAGGPTPPFTLVSCTAGTADVGPITESAVPGEPLLQRITATICGSATVVFTDSATPPVTYTVTISNLTYQHICFDKDVLLYMPNPSMMFGKIEVVTFECLTARFQAVDTVFSVCVTIGLRAIVKSEGRVQLRIPSFGYCPVPPTCRELGTLCEGFEAAPFPTVYPPQLEGTPPPTWPPPRRRDGHPC